MARRLKSYVDHLLDTEVLVVGGGLAGLCAAIQARRLGARVTVVDKAVVARSGVSVFAAGIFSVKFPEDDKEVWLEEMVRLGEYMNDQHWVDVLLDEVYPVAMQIHEWGARFGLTVFEQDDQGFVKRRSRGHVRTHHLVVNSLPMMDALRKIARLHEVELVERVMAVSLLLKDGRAAGILGFSPVTGESYLIRARAVILASGGCGMKSVYIGHRNLTGDAQAMALRTGATLKSMEQTGSNTVARDYDIHGLNLFVGSGGRFVNREDEEFMWAYRPDLGSRARQPDLVLAFSREVQEGRGPVFLDMSRATPQDQALMRKILPETFMLWDKAGIDPFRAPMEWIPAFRLKMGAGGGLHVDTWGRTTIPGLYGVGDAACAPQHGTYTIGGMNLAFAATSGVRAGRHAAEAARAVPACGLEDETGQVAALVAEMFAPAERQHGPGADEVTATLQRIIIPCEVSYLRSGASLTDALARLASLSREVIPRVRARDPHGLAKVHELRNMSCLAEAFLRSALLRQESRGFHFREDFPVTDNRAWLRWVFARQSAGEELETWSEPIPTPFLKPAEELTVPPGVRRK